MCKVSEVTALRGSLPGDVLAFRVVAILVVFGAGASYDSVNDQQSIPPGHAQSHDRPPLTKDLFGNRPTFGQVIDRYHRCRPLIVQLRAVLERSDVLLEAELTEVEDASKSDDAIASQMMAVRFYLRQILQRCGDEWFRLSSGCTNYHWLLDRLNRWAREHGEIALLVTFNYDDLLDRAFVETVGRPINELADYTSDARLKVFKLHGSVTWGHPMVFNPPPEVDETDFIIERARALDVPTEFELRHDWSSGIRGTGWVPALAVPVERKLAFECPPQHVTALEEHLGDVDRILSIGWRAAELTFLDLLSEHAKLDLKGLVVANAKSEDSESAARRLLETTRTSGSGAYRSVDTSMGFSDLVASDEIEMLLRAPGSAQ
jgi:hypothetical protein